MTEPHDPNLLAEELEQVHVDEHGEVRASTVHRVFTNTDLYGIIYNHAFVIPAEDDVARLRGQMFYEASNNVNRAGVRIGVLPTTRQSFNNATRELDRVQSAVFMNQMQKSITYALLHHRS